MAERRQLPPQIKRIELEGRAGGRPVVRYQLTVDIGTVDGKRKQLRKRYPTEAAARKALEGIRGEVATGTYVHPSKTTLRKACEDWLESKHRLKPSTLHGHREKLSPVIAELGHLEVQNLTKRQIDDLVNALRAGGLRSPTQKVRKAWSPRSVNYTLSLLTAVLEDQQKQGNLVRNVASLVDRVAGDPKPSATLTEDEVEAIEKHTTDDRYRIAWQLALAGLRRGEIAGLRWEDVDLQAKTLTIARNRVAFGHQLAEGTPKSKASARVLPLPEHLVVAFKTTKKFQAADRLALGTGYQPSGYVVVNEAGAPLSPGAISSRWEHVLERAGVRKVRLHDARHTCGTLMHLKGVPIAVVAAWLGHASSAFTQAVYTHSQPDAMTAAAQSFTRVVTNRDNSGSW